MTQEPTNRAAVHLTSLLAVVLTAVGPGSSSGVLHSQAPAYPETSKVRQDLGRLLERPKVALDPRFTVKTLGESDRASVEEGTFVSEPGKRVPALVVKSAALSGRRPAIVVLHGTGRTKEGMRDWLDGFASRGYVTMAIDARYHGAWIAGGAHGSQEYNDAAIAAWRSKPGAPREYPFWYDSAWDVVRAVDYLVSRSDVDPERIGVMGVSMGGIQTYLAAAIDPRIKAIVPIIATQSMRWSLEHDQWRGRARTIDTAHKVAASDLGESEVNQRVVRELWAKLIPGATDEFDGPSLVRLMAPRPLLILSTENDQNCPLPGAQLAFAQAEAAYRAAGAIDKLTIDVAPNAPHTVVPAHQRLANDWLDRQLRP